MQTIERAARRPFHETIIEAIRHATGGELWRCLAPLIKATRIPAGHDEIIAAWNKACREHHLHSDWGVPADLRAQKEEAAEKEKAKVTEAVSS